jgi:3-deoxy-D-manno-octulosonic-acid transferase
LRFIITPRHAERTPAILRELGPLNLRVQRRTGLAKTAEGCDLLLVDTTGELRDWYTLATVVFVGKSLTAIGGQNPVEPALLGRPVVFGPHMENFQAVVEHMLAHDAAVQVADALELPATLRALFQDGERRVALARNAAAALATHQGATARAAALLA